MNTFLALDSEQLEEHYVQNFALEVNKTQGMDAMTVLLP